MKELRNNFDTEIAFTNLDEAKEYYTPSFEFGCLEQEEAYADEIASAETLEELADVLNKHTDTFDNGLTWYVKEF